MRQVLQQQTVSCCTCLLTNGVLSQAVPSSLDLRSDACLCNVSSWTCKCSQWDGTAEPGSRGACLCTASS